MMSYGDMSVRGRKKTLGHAALRVFELEYFEENYDILWSYKKSMVVVRVGMVWNSFNFPLSIECVVSCL